MTTDITLQLPEPYRTNVEKAVRILREAGCREVYLFGSLAHGEIHSESDIDLAVRGCPRGEYFTILGRLFFELDYPVDLIDLDYGDRFANYLAAEGEWVQIG
jgi:predicted nucleotidyltransferase